MINPRWETAHGKQILVETLETPSMKALEDRKHQQFAKVPLQWAADAAKTTGTRGAMVWILLLHMAWKTKSTTFPLSNVMLAQYGVSREMKRRVLEKLEASGWIKIERRWKRNPIVNLLKIKNSKYT
jgi:hypothetical protein